MYFSHKIANQRTIAAGFSMFEMVSIKSGLSIVRVVNTLPQRLRVIWDGGEILQQFPLFCNNVGTPVRRADHSKQNHKGSLLDVVSVLDAVDGEGPVNTQVPDLIGFHDRMRGVGPPVIDKREEEDGLAKPEWLAVLECVVDTADELLEGPDGDGTGGVGKAFRSARPGSDNPW